MNRSPRRQPLSRTFWVLWAASTISFLGEGTTLGALPLLAASLTRDARLVSLTEVTIQAGWLLLGLISGVLVDRWSRTGVMWRADAVRAAVAAVFAGLVLADLASIPLLLAFGFVLGLVAPFFDNASSSVVPQIVPDGSLERANALTQTSLMLGANLVGPPAGAAMFVLLPGLPFAGQAVVLAVGATLVFTVRAAGPAPPVREDRHLWRELREGMAFLVRHRLLRVMALLLMLMNGMSSGVVAVLVLYVLEVLRLPEAAYGWLIAVFAVGGLLGAAVAPWLSRQLGATWTLIGAAVLLGIPVLGIGLWPVTAVVVLCVLLAGAVSVIWNVISLSVRQRIVPAELLGRVTSVYRVVAFAAMPGGAAASGLVAHAWGLRAPYLIGGLLVIAGALLAVPAIRSNPP